MLENLIHKKQIPVTIGIITPGNEARRIRRILNGNSEQPGGEHDSLSDARAVPDRRDAARWQDLHPDDRSGAAGDWHRSGAICAFTVAWHRPDVFRNVISMIGS